MSAITARCAKRWTGAGTCWIRRHETCSPGSGSSPDRSTRRRCTACRAVSSASIRPTPWPGSSTLRWSSPTRPASTRFRLLEPVRRYALDHLAVSGLADEVSRCHASYITERAESLGEPAGRSHRDRRSRRDRRAPRRPPRRVPLLHGTRRRRPCPPIDPRPRRRRQRTALDRAVVLVRDGARHAHGDRPPGTAGSARRRRRSSLAGQPAAPLLALADEAITTAELHDEAWVEAMTMRANGLLWPDRIDESVACIRAAVAADRQPRSARGMRRRGILALILNHAGRPDAEVGCTAPRRRRSPRSTRAAWRSHTTSKASCSQRTNRPPH